MQKKEGGLLLFFFFPLFTDQSRLLLLSNSGTEVRWNVLLGTVNS